MEWHVHEVWEGVYNGCTCETIYHSETAFEIQLDQLYNCYSLRYFQCSPAGAPARYASHPREHQFHPKSSREKEARGRKERVSLPHLALYFTMQRFTRAKKYPVDACRRSYNNPAFHMSLKQTDPITKMKYFCVVSKSFSAGLSPNRDGLQRIAFPKLHLLPPPWKENKARRKASTATGPRRLLFLVGASSAVKSTRGTPYRNASSAPRGAFLPLCRFATSVRSRADDLRRERPSPSQDNYASRCGQYQNFLG